jgi:hypothetical protein
VTTPEKVDAWMGNFLKEKENNKMKVHRKTTRKILYVGL